MGKMVSVVKIVVAVACVSSIAVAGGADKKEGKACKNKAAKEKVEKNKGGDRFEACDTDGNGSISLEEFSASTAKKRAAHKEKMGDKWSEEKAAKMPTAEKLFKKLDKDEDGSLSKKELAAGQKGKKGGKGKGKKKAGKGKKADKE